MTPDDLRQTTDMIHGGLLGVAVGNMLDASTRGSENPSEGRSDAALTRAVLEGYLSAGDTLHLVARGMWFRFPSNNLDADAATTVAIERLGAHLGSGAEPESNGLDAEDDWCGDGSLRRCLPTALATFYLDFDRRCSESRRISAITHAQPLCMDACVAYNEIAAALLNRVLPREAVLRAGRLSGIHHDVSEALDVRPDASPSSLFAAGHVLDTLRVAAWAVQQSDAFEDVLMTVIGMGGITAGSVVGGLLGIARGASSIPRRWTEVVPHQQQLADAAERFAEAQAGHLSVWAERPKFAILGGDGRDLLGAS